MKAIFLLFLMLVNPISLFFFCLVLTIAAFAISRSFKHSSRIAMVDNQLDFYSWVGGFTLGIVGAVFGLLISFILKGTEVLDSDSCSSMGFCFGPVFEYVEYQLFIWAFSFAGIMSGGRLGCRHRLGIKEEYNYHRRLAQVFLSLCAMSLVRLLIQMRS